MGMYVELAKRLDDVADGLESRGCVKEAADLDRISNTLEMLEAGSIVSPKAQAMAREMGINLTPETAAKIIAEHYDPQAGPITDVQAAGAAGRLGMLAALLVSGLLGQVEAKGPITIDTPFGQKTYSARDLKQLSRREPKTFALVMEQVADQGIDKALAGEKAEGLRRQQKRTPGMTGQEKVVADRKELSDQFGNRATLITYQDGTKELEGDILQGGVSFRKMMEDKGVVAPGQGEYAKQ
jgi:hypothetical protein